MALPNVFAIIEKTYKLKMDEIFDDEITDIIRISGLEVGCSKEYTAVPLLTSISHLLGLSQIRALKNMVQPCILYTGLLGQPSTGKTSALTLSKDVLKYVEKIEGIEMKESALMNCATVEALISLISELKCGISLWDEAAAFMSSFGLYKGGGMGANYDRSVILEFYNGSSYSRDIKNERTCIEQPRLNLCLAGHPDAFIKSIKTEKDINDDGLMQRFLLCCPEPAFLKADEIMSSEVNQCSLQRIFYCIKKIHKSSPIYELSDDANKVFDDLYDYYKNLVKLSIKNDSFLSSTYGKCSNQLLRLAIVLQAFSNSIQIVKKFSNADNKKIDNDFIIEIDNYIKNSPVNFIIEENTITSANKLLIYFINNRLLLAGYVTSNETNPHLDVSSNIGTVKTTIPDTNISIAKKILLYKCNIITVKNITDCSRLNSDDVKSVMKSLESDGFGTFSEVITNQKNRPKRSFIKINSKDFLNNLELGNKIQKYNCTPVEYVQIYKKAEEIVTNCFDESNDGTPSVNDCSDSSSILTSSCVLSPEPNTSTSTPKTQRKSTKLKEKNSKKPKKDSTQL